MSEETAVLLIEALNHIDDSLNRMIFAFILFGIGKIIKNTH